MHIHSLSLYSIRFCPMALLLTYFAAFVMLIYLGIFSVRQQERLMS